ncbi:MAG: ATP-binding protein [Patescibacteria group bacterium]
MKRLVLTGGPGVGKTTIIELLRARGYEVVGETARALIEAGHSGGNYPTRQKQMAEFQRALAWQQFELEENFSNRAVFFDRSLVDVFVFCAHYKVPFPTELQDKLAKRYDLVFNLEPLSVYANDAVRTESASVAREIHERLIATYQQLGYALISVPPLAPAARADFIVNHLALSKSVL